MITKGFFAMGTDWWLAGEDAAALAGAEAEVRRCEAVLSRFRPGSALCRLNRGRRARDPLLAEVVAAALAARELTAGAFDPTLGAALERLGYDRDFSLLRRPEGAETAHREGGAGAAPEAGPGDGPGAPRPALHVTVEGDEVRLDGEGLLDLGGIAKGWAVERVHRRLAADGPALVDGGGDLRASGLCWTVGAPGGHAVHLRDAALATSSTRRRRWLDPEGRAVHHLLDPRTGAPVEGVFDTVTVHAKDTVTAEVLAKAVLIRPALAARLPALGAAALLAEARGGRWVTPNWEEA